MGFIFSVFEGETEVAVDQVSTIEFLFKQESRYCLIMETEGNMVKSRVLRESSQSSETLILQSQVKSMRPFFLNTLVIQA